MTDMRSPQSSPKSSIPHFVSSLLAPPSEGYFRARWLYLRLLGFGFLVTFISLATQIHGLIGPRGILPAQELIETIKHEDANPKPNARAFTQPKEFVGEGKHERGWSGFWLAPSLLWLNAGDAALDALCWAGMATGALLLFNIWPRLTTFLGWLCWLSFVTVARNFSGFISDGLFLESALLAMFFAPSGVRPGLGERSRPSRAMMFLMWWFLFRIYFESGFQKFFGSDPSWRHLAAMDLYYENCPFPTWIGWYAQQLPRDFHAMTAALTLITELLGALCIFAPRPLRLGAFWAFTALQTSIALTGNYSYLSANTIAVGLLLLDDRTLSCLRFLKLSPTLHVSRFTFSRLFSAFCLATLFYVSTLQLFAVVFRVGGLPAPLLWPYEKLQPFRSANSYGFFGAMTEHRDHVEFESSNDGGKTWRVYRFKWQPQALDVAPRFMQPHLPRFDWNLWFATLDAAQLANNQIIVRTAMRLREGESTVLQLFADNPFSDHPPTQVRLALYRYHFTSLATKRQTGNWWNREKILP